MQRGPSDEFFKLLQMDGETITQYVARLRAQAVLCQFQIAHTDPDGQAHRLSYVDDMVAQQLISGLKNQHHQTQVLSEASTLTTLQSKIDKLQCLEATVLSTDQMRTVPTPSLNVHSVANQIRSSYKRDSNPRRQHPKQTPTIGSDNHRCRGCGRSSHKGKTMARKDCPAFDKVCRNCGIEGHFHAVCQRKTNNNQTSRASAANQNNIEDYTSDEDASFAFTTQDFRLGGPSQKKQT